MLVRCRANLPRRAHPRCTTLPQITGGAAELKPTAQTIIVTALMATQDSELLTRFSHSNALERVHEWLQETLQEPLQPQKTVA